MNLVVKDIEYENFQNYKECNTTIAFPTCTFKCCTECNMPVSVCQNSQISKQQDIQIEADMIIKNYISNPLSSAIVCGGLEPMDSFYDVYELLKILREKYLCDDLVVIYTGYAEKELIEEIESLQVFDNIIIKFGRYIPNQQPHYDNLLGVKLASDNQYAKQIS